MREWKEAVMPVSGKYSWEEYSNCPVWLITNFVDARLAQAVERPTNVPVVAGSIPAPGSYFTPQNDYTWIKDKCKT